MLGSAVSSSTPSDFQPNSHMGQRGSCPLMNRQALTGPARGCAYDAVGMQSALDSAIGLPMRSTSAPWILGFLIPAEVSRNLMGAPLLAVLASGFPRETSQRRSNHRSPQPLREHSQKVDEGEGALPVLGNLPT